LIVFLTIGGVPLGVHFMSHTTVNRAGVWPEPESLSFAKETGP